MRRLLRRNRPRERDDQRKMLLLVVAFLKFTLVEVVRSFIDVLSVSLKRQSLNSYYYN